ncbi:hypothetical protein [Serratia fonticola]|uniref:hypothetical protein n=1 Tax=Serratia fonticola TaxID=47917 RepID=UPI00217AFB33|nr:hypothetical protein [Serratia fonticola]CAI1847530.1 Uncharacterised protein [Serratia fonticola]
MARPKKMFEVPGQQNTPAELHAATAGATAIEQTTQQRVATLLDVKALEERNAMLSALPAAGFEIVTRFEAYGFVDA